MANRSLSTQWTKVVTWSQRRDEPPSEVHQVPWALTHNWNQPDVFEAQFSVRGKSSYRLHRIIASLIKFKGWHCKTYWDRFLYNANEGRLRINFMMLSLPYLLFNILYPLVHLKELDLHIRREFDWLSDWFSRSLYFLKEILSGSWGRWSRELFSGGKSAVRGHNFVIF